MRAAAFRRRTFRGPMARLALVAVLLLSLVPTLGRLAQARAAGVDAAPSWAALCTARGLQPVLLAVSAHGAAHGDVEVPAPTPHGAAGGDCDYCPLLATTLPVAVAPLSVPPAAAPAPALCTSRTSPARGRAHPCGLGSRGPPNVS
jgi:hypothetical protein